MLTIYRLHKGTCQAHRPRYDRGYRKCQCPIHVDGRAQGKEIRRALKTTNWAVAQKLVHELELTGDRDEERVEVREALGRYRTDVKNRGLAQATQIKIDGILRQLHEFIVAQGIKFLDEVDLDAMRLLREGWGDQTALTVKLKLTHVQSFFKFCIESGWIKENPVAKVRRPLVNRRPTMPYNDAELRRLYQALEVYEEAHGAVGRQMTALVLVLLNTGLRIQDAVTLSTERIQGDRLFLYTQKTKVGVYIPLAPQVQSALMDCPLGKDRYYFWTGVSHPWTCKRLWQRRLEQLLGAAGIEGGHAHRFRDTFAVNLLRRGVPLEHVSKLLGHRSIKVTEEHYAPWVTELQEKLESSVRKLWDAPVKAAS